MTETQLGYRLAWEGAVVKVVVKDGDFLVEGLESDGNEPYAVISLLIAVERFALEHGFEKIHVYHSGSARDEDMSIQEQRLYQFYRKHGFKPSYTIITKEL